MRYLPASVLACCAICAATQPALATASDLYGLYIGAAVSRSPIPATSILPNNSRQPSFYLNAFERGFPDGADPRNDDHPRELKWTLGLRSKSSPVVSLNGIPGEHSAPPVSTDRATMPISPSFDGVAYHDNVYTLRTSIGFETQFSDQWSLRNNWRLDVMSHDATVGIIGWHPGVSLAITHYF